MRARIGDERRCLVDVGQRRRSVFGGDAINSRDELTRQDGESEHEREERERRAKAICADCAVQRDCFDYAMTIRELHGIWGGLTEAERRMILTQDAG